MTKLICKATGVVVEVADAQAAARMKKGGFTEQVAAKPATTTSKKTKTAKG